MHARYCFYYPSGRIENARATTEDWIRENGTENNWYEMLCGVNNENEWQMYASDFRGLDNFTEELRDDRPTFDDIHRFAWEKVVKEQIGYNARWIDRDERSAIVENLCEQVEDTPVEDLSEEIVESLVDHFSDNSLWEKPTDTDDGIGREIHSSGQFRTKVGSLVQELHSDNGKPPFTFGGSPYSNRCIRVGGYPGEPGETIVVADIHT